MTCLNQPFGCQSDQLSDVLCYKIIVDRITETLQNRSFNLIECIAALIFDAVAHYLIHQDQHGAILEVVIAKPNHPVANVHGAMSFKYCRRLSQKSL